MIQSAIGGVGTRLVIHKLLTILPAAMSQFLILAKINYSKGGEIVGGLPIGYMCRYDSCKQRNIEVLRNPVRSNYLQHRPQKSRGYEWYS